MEHSRLIDLIKVTSATGSRPPAATSTTVVADMMAGVGPFAVPLSMAKVRGTLR